jgi:glycosyltransferase involved in cell wall biosynthesis
MPNGSERPDWPWNAGHGQQQRVADSGDMPRITIITSSYNKAEYLERAIRSVLLQGYPDLEYLVIDGGSTDGSVDIIKRYENRLAYWVSEPDRGQSHALNKGLERATGEIVGWVHADDMLFPGALHTLAAAYNATPGAAIYSGAGAKIDENDNILKTVKSRPYDPVLFRTRCTMFQPSTFINRAALDAAGHLDESLHFWMDWDLYLRLVRHGSVATLDDPIGMWRAHQDTKTRAGSYVEQRREIARIARRHNGYFDRNNVAFMLLHYVWKLEGHTRLRSVGYVRKKIAGMLDRIYGAETYYNAGMFEARLTELHD